LTKTQQPGILIIRIIVMQKYIINGKIEIPTNQYEKERLMKYYGVTNDKELKVEVYREFLKKERNKRR